MQKAVLMLEGGAPKVSLLYHRWVYMMLSKKKCFQIEFYVFSTRRNRYGSRRQLYEEKLRKLWRRKPIPFVSRLLSHEKNWVGRYRILFLPSCMMKTTRKCFAGVENEAKRTNQWSFSTTLNNTKFKICKDFLQSLYQVSEKRIWVVQNRIMAVDTSMAERIEANIKVVLIVYLLILCSYL